MNTTETLPVTGRSRGMLASFERREGGSNALAAEQMRRELLRKAQHEAILAAERKLYRPRHEGGCVVVPVDGDPSRTIRIAAPLYARVMKHAGLQGSRWRVDVDGAICARMRGLKHGHPDWGAWFDVVAAAFNLSDGDKYKLRRVDTIGEKSVMITRKPVVS